MKILLFLAILVGLAGVRESVAQVDSVPPARNIAAEQDYVFAYGLYEDSLYQPASVQFERYLARYADGPRRMEASFLAAECHFRMGGFEDAVLGFERFLSEFPAENWSADAYFRRGEGQLRLNRNAEAVESFKIVLERFGESAVASEAAYWVGEAFFRQGDFDNALKYYGLAYENQKGTLLRDYAAYSTGWVYQSKGNHPKALEWYRKVKSEFPTSRLQSSARIRSAECLLATKAFQDVLQELGGLEATHPSAEEAGDAQFLKGETFYGMSEFRKARLEYQAFLAGYPDHRKVPEARYALAWTLLKLNELDAAEAGFDELVKGNTAFAEPALYRRGVVESLTGKKERALSTWQSVLDRFPRGSYADDALFEGGTVRYGSKDFQGALADFERIIQLYPESELRAEAFRMQGECRLALGQFDLAHKSFLAAGAESSAPTETKIDAAFQSAWSLFKQDLYADAADGFSGFLERHPTHPRATAARFWRAESRYRLNDYARSAEDYRLVAGSAGSPHALDALYGLGWSQFKLGDYQGAIQSFEHYLQAAPPSHYTVDAQLRLGDSYFSLKQYEKAAGVYRSMLRTMPKDTTLDYAQFQLAQATYRLGDGRAAAEQYEELLERFPTSALADDAQYALGWIPFQEGKYEAAILAFQKTVQNYPGTDMAGRALYSIGDAYYNLGTYAAAEKSYRRVLAEYPSSPLVVDAIGGIQYCLLAQGDRTGAIRTIDEFLRQNPSAAASDALQIKKGDIYYSLGDFRGAIAEYDAFISGHPTSPLLVTAEYWGAKSARSAGLTEQAIERYLRTASMPGGPDALKAQSLLEAAELQRGRKQYTAALSTLSKLDSLYPAADATPEGAYLKALVHGDAGDVLQSISQLEHNLSRFPATAAADRSRLKLASIFLVEGNTERALALAKSVATSRTDDLGAEGQYLIGVTLAQEGRLEEAITEFLKVRYVFRRFDLWMAKSYIALGGVYERLKELQRAREAYRRAAEYEQLPELVEEARTRLDRLDQR